MSDGAGSWWPSAETLSDIGHGALDVVGLLPGFGEPADIANAAWYAAQENYLEAGLSLISAIPFVGYAGTVGKLVKKFGVKPSKAALEALQKVDFGKAFERFRSNPKLAPYVDKMVAALDKWRKDLLEKFSPKVTPGRCVACEKAASTKAEKMTLPNATKGWKPGDPINNLTAAGKVPSWSTVRSRYWKNEAISNPSTYSKRNLSRLEQGLAPQRINPRTGQIESMELNHTPPQRDGGLFDVEKLWPDEHAAVDPFRKVKK